MRTVGSGIGGGIARALLALVVMILAFGPPLDTAAHAATKAIEAGDSSPFLKLVSAFDVLDDAFDHIPGDRPSEHPQAVIQLALPQPLLMSVTIPHVTPVELHPATAIPWASRMPSPLDRPPRA